MKTAIFYHAGCPVCQAAESQLLAALDPGRYSVETVHLGREPWRISEAEAVGVRSVPAVVIDGRVFHINYGGSLEQLKETYRYATPMGQAGGCCGCP